MKIYIIRHGKVNMKWPKYCNSVQFDEACHNYDSSKIDFISNTESNIKCNTIYISALSRTLDTARCLFPNQNYITLEDIKEVPLKSFIDNDKIILPIFIWNIMGRLQWLFNSKRQDESRYMTKIRAEKVVYELENDKKDKVLVTHGFFMKTLIKCFKEKGYLIEGHSMFGFYNLQVIIAEK